MMQISVDEIQPGVRVARSILGTGTGAQDPSAPLDAMRKLIADAGGKLNSHVVNSLISLIPVFPLGTKILIAKAPRSLLVGYQGVVTKANPKDKEKPQVILLFDKFRRKIKPIVIDLAQENGFALRFAALAP